MILFRDVTKKFGDSNSALESVSFAVEPGELVVITGPSGSGKTTLMRLLTKEYLPTSGEISFQGTDLAQIADKHIHQLRRQVGVVFQDYKLLPELTVWENIALPLEILGQKQIEISARVADLLTLVGMENKASLFPAQLSGGEAQRVSISRALAPAPAVVFADEPTGNLDPDTSVAIGKLFEQINQLGTTVLLATHDTVLLDLLKKYRRIHLQNGSLENTSDQAKKTSKTKIATNDDESDQKKVSTNISANNSKSTNNKKPSSTNASDAKKTKDQSVTEEKS